MTVLSGGTYTRASGDTVQFQVDQASYRRTLAYLGALATVVPAQAAEELTRIATEWQSSIRLHMPVDTGLARNSVAVAPAQITSDSIQAAVGTNVPYVPYLEFGTHLIAHGDVMEWVPGQEPILHWPTKDEAARDSGNVLAHSVSDGEFMPPFRGSWQLIAEQMILRLRRRLALSLREAMR